MVKDYEVGSDSGVLLRRCELTNKCAEVTCEHGGRCRHVPRAPHVYCDCDNTGYTGATCRTANSWRSCQQFLQFTRIRSANYIIKRYISSIYNVKLSYLCNISALVKQ